ncbi:hypothetical protein DL96DRAFT_1822524 [Flagelloscypha sp. PMI_526]|nr:hypothetical protein DL96DRAFT_1822524 [Flagelloscypha sp. PMI_526]
MTSTLDNDELMSLVVTAVREIPVLTKDTAPDWSSEHLRTDEFVEDIGYGKDHETAVLNFLKAYLSLVFYPAGGMAEMITAVKEKSCTTLELEGTVELIEGLFDQLSTYDIREGQAVYNMNIFAQYFELIEDSPDLSSIQAAFLQATHALDLLAMTNGQKVEIEKEHNPIVDPFPERLEAVLEEAGDEEFIKVLANSALGEMRKGCLLVALGPPHHTQAAPFFINARTCISKFPVGDAHDETIMFVYQRVLPPEVFERIIRLSYVRDHPSVREMRKRASRRNGKKDMS